MHIVTLRGSVLKTQERHSIRVESRLVRSGFAASPNDSLFEQITNCCALVTNDVRAFTAFAIAGRNLESSRSPSSTHLLLRRSGARTYRL